MGTDRRDAVGEDLPHVALDELVDHELLGELHDEPGELLERRLRPAPGVQVDREVDPARDALRVDDAVADDALHRQRLEVGAAHVEQERELAVVDRHFRDRGVDRAEPERLARPFGSQLPAAVGEHVARRLGTQVAQQRQLLDLSHAWSILYGHLDLNHHSAFWSVLTFTR